MLEWWQQKRNNWITPWGGHENYHFYKLTKISADEQSGRERERERLEYETIDFWTQWCKLTKQHFIAKIHNTKWTLSRFNDGSFMKLTLFHWILIFFQHSFLIVEMMMMNNNFFIKCSIKCRLHSFLQSEYSWKSSCICESIVFLWHHFDVNSMHPKSKIRIRLRLSLECVNNLIVFVLSLIKC